MEVALRESTIDFLPPEIIAEIMDCVYNSYSDIAERYPVPYGLCLVSRKWNTIASATPTLWVSCRIFALNWEPSEYRPRLQVFERRILRTGRLPLDLHLQVKIERNDHDVIPGDGFVAPSHWLSREELRNALELLPAFIKTYSHKWRSIRMVAEDYNMISGMFLPPTLLNLETAIFYCLPDKLTTREEEEGGRPVGLEIGKLSGPKLQRLIVHGEIRSIAWGSLDTPSVTEITLACHCDIIIASFLHLAAFKNLRILSISQLAWHNQWPWQDDWLADIPPLSVILLALEELYMERFNYKLMSDAFRIFQMPNLATLAISRMPSSKQLAMEYPCLRSFAVAGVDGRDVELMRTLFKGARGLKRLAVGFYEPDDDQPDGIGLTMKQLLFENGDGEDSRLCPKLQKLYTNISPEECEDVLKLLPDLVILPGFDYQTRGRDLFEDRE